MTWAQTVTIVAPILVAAIGGLFDSSRHIDQLAHQVGDRINDLRTDMNARFASVDGRFVGMEGRFAEIHQDLQELRGLLHEALRPRAS